MNNTGPRGGCTLLLSVMFGTVVLIGFFFWMALIAPEPVFGMGMEQPAFGTYSQTYLERRRLKYWKELCKGDGRYQAMSEAYDARRPNPCTGAKEWVR